MNNEELVWFSLDKDSIPGVASGVSSPKGRDFLSPEAAYSAGGSVAAGYVVNEHSGFRVGRSPDVFVIRDYSDGDIFSWLKTFSPDSFPISQFARVLTIKEWDAVSRKVQLQRDPHLDRWSCVILGEAVAQGGGEGDIGSIPLSRAAACFTATMARVKSLYSADGVTRLCADRLRQIEADRRFVRRPVAVEDLVPIWGIISSGVDDFPDAPSVVEFVLDAVMRVQSLFEKKDASPGRILADFDDLYDDSIESRVVSFNRLASYVLDSSRSSGRVSQVMSAILAAGAFLVGRGTSHFFLLRKLTPLAPSSYIWFGLMAALIGPRGWHGQWARTVKGFERQIAGGFSWAQPVSGDISWEEYSWVSKNISLGNAFNDVARLVARTLTIEVVPGAVCQLRGSGDEAASSSESASRRQVESSPPVHAEELRSLLEQFVALANRSRKILSAADTSVVDRGGGSSQPELNLHGDEGGGAVKPKSRARRSSKKAK
ncbi:MAG: hypothetical protein AB1832_13270 [Pseudomonadota bacterium]